MPKRKSIPQVGLGVDELCEPMSMMSPKRGRPPAAHPKVNRTVRLDQTVNDYLKSVGAGNASTTIEDAVRASAEFRLWKLQRKGK